MEKLIDVIDNTLIPKAIDELGCVKENLYVFEVESESYLPNGLRTAIGRNKVFFAQSSLGTSDKHAMYKIDMGSYSYVYFVDYMFEDICLVFIEKKNYKTFRKTQRAKYLLENPKQKKYDIIIPQALQETLLHHTVAFYRILKKFEEYNLSRNKGILLYGPPGNGKTSLIKWICGKMEDEGARVHLIKDPMQELKGKEKGVLVFDDINVELFNRATSPEAAKFLLTYLDGMSSKSSQIRLFSTNEHIDQIEDAFLRPGRIDVAIEVSNPCDESREEYYHGISSDVRKHFTLSKWMQITEGMSFAQLANIYSNALACVLIDDDVPDLDKIVTNIKESMSLKTGSKKKKIGLV